MTTKITTYKAHFDRNINTTLSNVTTETSSKNLSYRNKKNYTRNEDSSSQCKRGLKPNSYVISNQFQNRSWTSDFKKDCREMNRHTNTLNYKI